MAAFFSFYSHFYDVIILIWRALAAVDQECSNAAFR
jgi:hypothetical protein